MTKKVTYKEVLAGQLKVGDKFKLWWRQPEPEFWEIVEPHPADTNDGVFYLTENGRVFRMGKQALCVVEEEGAMVPIDSLKQFDIFCFFSNSDFENPPRRFLGYAKQGHAYYCRLGGDPHVYYTNRDTPVKRLEP